MIGSRLRIGVLGCADFAWRKAVPALLQAPELELAAVASRSLEKAEKFATTFGGDPLAGYERLIERRDIDAVYVPLPPSLHEGWVLKALEAGKHVFVEKPFSLTAASARRMVEAARSRGRFLMEDFAFRHHGQTAGAREMIGRGDLGEIRVLRASFGYPPPAPANIRYDRSLGGGALLDCGVYCAQAALLFLGQGLKAVGVHLRQDQAKGVDVSGAAMLASPSGQVAQLAFGFEHFYQCEVALWGSQGKLTLERAFTPLPDQEAVVWLERQGRREERRFPAENQYVSIFQHFARTAVSGKDFEAEYARILEQAVCVEAIQKGALP
ncbi:MAG: Gfo/Idh/MocA family oxidoreductase [Elusimicrobia bacterium]|nr:Gfo/Idh/MocA family oxidoreductase [Elusimicrobiota bacterium]